MKKCLKISVLGGGAFGSAMATAAARNGHKVIIYDNHEKTVSELNHRKIAKFHGFSLHKNIIATSNVNKAIRDSNIIFHAIPVQSSYEFIKSITPIIPENIPYIICSKGILLKQKKFFSQIWKELTDNKLIPHCVLSGPSYAIEVIKHYHTEVTLACNDIEVAKYVQNNFTEESFRIFCSTDVIGVEINGALKNPLAIAAGIVSGEENKFNISSALVTKGLEEISVFNKTFGGRLETLKNLSGVGDISLTCLGTLSRGKSFGQKLSNGINISQISQNELVEGVATCKVLGQLIKDFKLKMPIFETLSRILNEDGSVQELYDLLMKDETH